MVALYREALTFPWVIAPHWISAQWGACRRAISVASLQRRIALLIRADDDAFCQDVSRRGLKDLIPRRARTNVECPVQRQHLEVIVVWRVAHRGPGPVVAYGTAAGCALEDPCGSVSRGWTWTPSGKLVTEAGMFQATQCTNGLMGVESGSSAMIT